MSDSAEEEMGTDRATYPMVLSSGSLQGSGDKMLPCAQMPDWHLAGQCTRKQLGHGLGRGLWAWLGLQQV